MDVLRGPENTATDGARIELMTADTAPLLVSGLFDNSDPGVIAAAYAQVPELCLAALPFLGESLSPAILGPRWTEMAILRTSARLECRYCVTAHTPVALDSDLDHDEVAALRLEGDDAVFDDDADAVVLAYIDAVATGHGAVPEALDLEVAAHLEDHQRVSLVNTVGVTMLLNRFCSVLGLPAPADAIARCATEGFGGTA